MTNTDVAFLLYCRSCPYDSARRMDGSCNQNADKLGSLAGPSLLTVYVGVVECATDSLPPVSSRRTRGDSSSLTHAYRMDGFCNQNADKLGSLTGPSLLTVHVGVVECESTSLPTASSSLTHARRMDGFCNQNADQLGYLAGPSLLTVYVGVVECASASPYTYSTHSFPDERTPIGELHGHGVTLSTQNCAQAGSQGPRVPKYQRPLPHMNLNVSERLTRIWPALWVCHGHGQRTV
jgi:hypothetical protein